MRNKISILILITAITLLSSCTKEDLPTPKNETSSIDMILPIPVEEIDTTRYGLYLGKKVTKGTKQTILNGSSSVVKSP